MPRLVGNRSVALVTGASSGAGRALARGLASRGAHVLGVARQPIEEPSVAQWIVGDLSSREDVLRIADEIEAAVGDSLSIFAHFAGLLIRDSQPPADIDDWRMAQAMFNVHFNAPLLLIRRLSAALSKDTGIVLVASSTSAARATPRQTGYGATKAASESLVRSLASEVGPAGVRVIGIRPGAFRSRMSEALFKDARQVAALEANTPLRRLGASEDIAQFAVSLASSASGWVTGTVIDVDGGALSSW